MALSVAITADYGQAAAHEREPLRALCEGCERPVLIAVVAPPKARGLIIVRAEPYEWEPRAECQSCAWTRARTGRLVDCPRCGGSGYVGEKRPRGVYMLAIDCAWSDEGRMRLLAPANRRRRGEALHQLHFGLHGCDHPAIVPVPEHERQAA